MFKLKRWRCMDGWLTEWGKCAHGKYPWVTTMVFQGSPTKMLLRLDMPLLLTVQVVLWLNLSYLLPLLPALESIKLGCRCPYETWLKIIKLKTTDISYNCTLFSCVSFLGLRFKRADPICSKVLRALEKVPHHAEMWNILLLPPLSAFLPNWGVDIKSIR